MAIILLLVFTAATVAVWSTLTTDHGSDLEFIVTPTPTASDDGTPTPEGSGTTNSDRCQAGPGSILATSDGLDQYARDSPFRPPVALAPQ